MNLRRRGFLGGLGALCAPAIIRTPGLLMPLPRTRPDAPCPDFFWVYDETMKLGYDLGIGYRSKSARVQTGTMRICHSCAATPREATFPPRGPFCVECLREASRPPPASRKAIQTRRAYRAALRHRSNSAQLDLVDMIVRSP